MSPASAERLDHHGQSGDWVRRADSNRRSRAYETREDNRAPLPRRNWSQRMDSNHRLERYERPDLPLIYAGVGTDSGNRTRVSAMAPPRTGPCAMPAYVLAGTLGRRGQAEIRRVLQPFFAKATKGILLRIEFRACPAKRGARSRVEHEIVEISDDDLARIVR
jgi:hypothetical protein